MEMNKIRINIENDGFDRNGTASELANVLGDKIEITDKAALTEIMFKLGRMELEGEAKPSIILKLFKLGNGSAKRKILERVETKEFGKLVCANEKIFNKVWDLLEIKTIEDLEKLFSSGEFLKMMIHADERVFDEVCEYFGINTKEKLEDLMKNWIVCTFITIVKIEVLRRLLKLEDLKTIEDLMRLIKTIKLDHLLNIKLLNAPEGGNVRIVFDSLGINRIDDLKYIADEETVEFIHHSKKGNLIRIFKLKGLDKESFKRVSKNEKVLNLMRYANEEVLEIVLDFVGAKKVEDLEDLADYEAIPVFTKLAKKGVVGKIVNFKDINKESFKDLIKDELVLRSIAQAEDEFLVKTLDFLNVNTAKKFKKMALLREEKD